MDRGTGGTAVFEGDPGLGGAVSRCPAGGAIEAALHFQRGEADAAGANPDCPWTSWPRSLANDPGGEVVRRETENCPDPALGQEPEFVVHPPLSARAMRCD